MLPVKGETPGDDRERVEYIKHISMRVRDTGETCVGVRIICGELIVIMIVNEVYVQVDEFGNRISQ